MQKAQFVTESPFEQETAADSQSAIHYTTAFTELDESHRVVLFLHYLECLSLYQIARVLDDTEEHVREVYLEAIRRLGGGEKHRDAA